MKFYVQDRKCRLPPSFFVCYSNEQNLGWEKNGKFSHRYFSIGKKKKSHSKRSIKCHWRVLFYQEFSLLTNLRGKAVSGIWTFWRKLNFLTNPKCYPYNRMIFPQSSRVERHSLLILYFLISSYTHFCYHHKAFFTHL